MKDKQKILVDSDNILKGHNDFMLSSHSLGVGVGVGAANKIMLQ